MNLAPIVIFVYNRLDLTEQTIFALQENILAKDSELFIFSDAAKNEQDITNVHDVRKFIYTINGFKKVTIIEREANFGLAKSIIFGVTDIVNKYGKVIVLEDDLLTSKYFLMYMNESLELYKDDLNVASIHGYIYPIENLPNTFFIKGADCWGWATWSRSWKFFEEDGQKLLSELNKRKLQKEIDFNNSFNFVKMLKAQIKGKNNSWAVRWYISAYLNNMLTLYPGKSYVHNIGFGNNSTHCSENTKKFDIELNQEFNLSRIDVQEDVNSRKKMEAYFLSIKPTIFSRILAKFRNFF